MKNPFNNTAGYSKFNDSDVLVENDELDGPTETEAATAEPGPTQDQEPRLPRGFGMVDDNQNTFLEPDRPNFNDTAIILPEDTLSAAPKAAPMILCRSIEISSRTACEIFILVNILTHLLQFGFHVFGMGSDDAPRLERSIGAGILQKLFFTLEWGLAIYALYGLRRDRQWKLVPYTIYAIFEQTMQLFILAAELYIFISHAIQLHSTEKEQKMQELAMQPNMTHAERNMIYDIHDTSKRVSVYLVFAYSLTRGFICGVGALELYCLYRHRRFLIETYGREPLKTICCGF